MKVTHVREMGARKLFFSKTVRSSRQGFKAIQDEEKMKSSDSLEEIPPVSSGYFLVTLSLSFRAQCNHLNALSGCDRVMKVERGLSLQ